MPRTLPSRVPTLPLVLAVAAIGISAYVVADLASAQRRPAPQSPPSSAGMVASPASARRDPQTLLVRTRDFAFTAPDTVAAGRTVVRLINDGPDLHHVMLAKLDSGHSVAELAAHFQTGEGPLPAWATAVGGPNPPGAPGSETNATVDLTPGLYAMFCVIPAMSDGMPHVMKGMIRPLVVVDRGTALANASAPIPDVRMTLDDYGFTVDAPIRAGRRTIRVTNRAAQSHEVVIVRLEPGRTPEDFLKFVAQRTGTPPGTLVGGVAWLARARANDITIDFTPGEYALICFVPDAKDGRPHFMHGMVRQFRVS